MDYMMVPVVTLATSAAVLFVLFKNWSQNCKIISPLKQSRAVLNG